MTGFTRLLTASALALMAGGALAQHSDRIKIAIQLEPPHLDPTGGAAEAIDSVVYGNIFEGLTRFTEDGSVVPGLAESWTISDDGLVYTFSLRDGVMFHDGSTFDAEDVKFSLDRARAEDSTNAQKQLFAQIDEVVVVDPLTVEVRLDQPNGSFLFNMAWGDAVIVGPESVENNARYPIGTGPFLFADWTQGYKVALARNDQYWGEAPVLWSAEFYFVSDPTAALGAMMTGEFDAFIGYPAPENLPEFEARDGYQVITGSTEGETILAMNNAAAPFDNPLVRAAVAHAIDRQAIIDGAMYGYGVPIGTHFAPHHPAYVDLTELSPYDPDRARELLAEAGMPDGFSTTLHLPPPSYARRGGEIVAAQLRAVGIEAQIINVEWAQWLEQVFGGKDFGLTIISHTEPMDINIYANPDYYFQYDNPAFREVMDELTATTDEERRAELMGVLQTIIAEDHVNGFLFQLPLLTVANERVQGLWPNQPVAAIDLSGISWAE